MRRMFWVGVGAAAGASGTLWAQRRIREGIDQLGADQVVAAAGRGARSVGRTVVAAVAEGRDGMALREIELRRRVLGVEDSLDLRREPDTHREVVAHRGRRKPPVSVRRTGR